MTRLVVGLIVCWVSLAAREAPGDFDIEWARLEAGRQYRPARTGSIEYRLANIDGASFETVVEVPASYDPARRWPVRVQLHGGVNRPLERGRRRAHALALSTPEIVVHPRAWREAQWWHGSQVDNVLDVLARLKREYNVDESRVYLAGFSDGGTGAYFFGMRAPTAFSAILPLHGSLGVLANPDVRVDGQLYPGNLVNRPIFATNGARDPLYPASEMTPIVDTIERAGAELVYLALPFAGHDTQWWAAERDRVEGFLAKHPRDAHRGRLSWETERTDRYNRIDWLVINELGAAASDQPLPDVNPAGFGRKRASGRVDVSRTGNRFEARTRGVRRFTLLLSPRVIDFGKPVSVVVNGRLAFEGAVAKDRGVLRRWAERDDDRTMLYAAELRVEVK
jgi:predicted esterase